MKVNHEQTKRLIIDIVGILREQAHNTQNYRKSRDDVLSDENTSDSYKHEKIQAMCENYLAGLEKTKEMVSDKLNTILEIESENDDILEYDIPEFANTLSAINSAHGKLPPSVMGHIKLNFAGHYQVLKTIVAAFEHYEIDIKQYSYDEYIENANSQIAILLEKASNLEQSEISGVLALKKLCNDVIHFGELRGLEFTDSEKSFGVEIDDAAAEILARSAMGLPIK